MASEWPILTIAECASSEPYSTQIGPFGEKIRAESYTASGAPVLRGTNVNTNARFHDNDFVFIDADIAKNEFDKFVCEAGDVILCHKGTLGKIGIIPENNRFGKYIMGNSMMKVRCDRSKLEPLYLYYWLCSRNGQDYLFSRVSQVGVPQIQRPLTTLREAPLPVPPLPEQKAIARILGTLDDKIELNRQMNATLEAMARALFRSWFVDFDPVRRNAGSARSGRKSEKGKVKNENSESSAPSHFSLPTSHFAFDSLFPSTFQNSELGEIPEAWDIKSIGEAIELAYGKPLKAEDRKNGPIAVYGSNGQVGWHNGKLVSGPGIIVGRKGNPGIVTWAHGDFYPIDTTFYVVPISDCTSYYYLYYALSAKNLANLGADSAVPGLNRNQAYMSKLVIPPIDLLKEFDTQAAPLFSKIHSNEMQSRALSTLRDSLLPKLLSGTLSFEQPKN